MHLATECFGVCEPKKLVRVRATAFHEISGTGSRAVDDVRWHNVPPGRSRK